MTESSRVPLTAASVVSVYEELLRRTPNDDEVEAQLAGCQTLRDLLRIVRDSDEYAARLREGGWNTEADVPRANVWHSDLSAWTHPPGMRSRDGVAIVGHDGFMFIRGGTNAMVDQYRGAQAPPHAWLEAWCSVLAQRAREARAMGVDLTGLVVPDKLLIEEERFPEAVELVGPRPVQRLLDVAGDRLLYPLDRLRAARSGGAVTLRTDSHLTLRGNAVLTQSLLDAASCDIQVEVPEKVTEMLISGDLGSRMEPRVFEPAAWTYDYGSADVVEDNRDEIAAVGGHVGSRRVLRNAVAPDPRVAVIFGDSYAFPSPYYNGIGWYLAQVFAELHFCWLPFGWDLDYVRDSNASVVFMQTAERFVARVPLHRVDLRSLAAATIAGAQPAGLDSFSRAM